MSDPVSRIIAKKDRSGGPRKLFGGMVLLIMVAIFYSFGHKTTPSKNTTTASSSQPGKMSSSKEFIWIRANQRLIAKRLKDPDSAKFSGDYVSYKMGGPVVCGTVNAKNGFGGYTGPMRYIGMGTTLGVFLASDADFDILWRKAC